jgi:hypothetical protein
VLVERIWRAPRHSTLSVRATSIVDRKSRFFLAHDIDDPNLVYPATGGHR